MKKVILMSGIAFFAIVALSSCKKDYTCYCSDSDQTTIKNQTKKKAKEICEGDVNVGVISVSGDNGCYLL